MNKTEEDDAKADAITKGEPEKERPKRTKMEIAIYICGVLVGIGGLWMGYLGVAGHLKDQKLLGLWVFYGTLISLVTGAFLFFHQRIVAQDAAARAATEQPTPFVERPELSIEKVYVKTLEPGKPEIIIMEIQNRGKLTAHKITIYSTLVHEYTAFQGPLVHKPTDPQVVTSIASGATITSAFHSTWINTAEDVEAIKSGKIQLFHFGKGHYEDQAGKRYPFDYCFLYDPSVPRSMMISPAQYWPKDGHVPPMTTTRPELFVERATAELLPGRPKRVAVELVNRGSGEAKRLTVWMNQALAKPDFPGPLKFEALEPDTRPSIGPNGIVTLVGGKNEPITTAEYEAIRKGTRVWFIFGKGVYEDGTGNNWPITFCFQYEPSIAPVMRICPDKYWPKQVAAKAVIDHLPELSLEHAECQLVPGKPARVSIVIENRGKATAYDIEAEATNYFAHARTFKGPMEHEPSDPPYFYPSLAPGAKMFGHTEQSQGGVLSIQDVADLRDRKLLFLHYSKGTYTDKDKNTYPLDFCLLYDPDLPVMRIAPKAYWPRSLSDF